MINLTFISNLKVTLDINNIKIDCNIKRHLSPSIVRQIANALPMESTIHYMNRDFIYFQTKLISGVERPKKQFKRGDIAYLPENQSICIFLQNATTKVMTPIGHVLDDLDGIVIEGSKNIVKFYATG